MSPAVIAGMTHVAVAVTALRSVESCGKWTHNSGEFTPAAAVATLAIQDIHVSLFWRKYIFLSCVSSIFFNGFSKHRLAVSHHCMDCFLSVKLQDGYVEFFWNLFFLLVSINTAVPRTCKTFWAKYSFKGVWIRGPADRVCAAICRSLLSESRGWVCFCLWGPWGDRHPPHFFPSAQSHVFILSPQQHAQPQRSACDFEQEAAQGIKFRGFKNIVLCNPHQSQNAESPFSNELLMLHSCVLDFFETSAEAITLSFTDKKKLLLVFYLNLKGLLTFDFRVFSLNSRLCLDKNPAGLQRRRPRPPWHTVWRSQKLTLSVMTLSKVPWQLLLITI